MAETSDRTMREVCHSLGYDWDARTDDGQTTVIPYLGDDAAFREAMRDLARFMVWVEMAAWNGRHAPAEWAFMRALEDGKLHLAWPDNEGG